MTQYCTHCGRPFQPRPQVPNQTYCSSAECQRERRRRWQQQKRRDDPDYRDNDARADKAWAAGNPAYWKQYRDENPTYADRNRTLQQLRNQNLRAPLIANEDVFGRSIAACYRRPRALSVHRASNSDARPVHALIRCLSRCKNKKKLQVMKAKPRPRSFAPPSTCACPPSTSNTRRRTRPTRPVCRRLEGVDGPPAGNRAECAGANGAR